MTAIVCPRCGHTSDQDTPFCNDCGAARDAATPRPVNVVPRAVAHFCRACGAGLVGTAVVCVTCGSPVHPSAVGLTGGKSKMTALLLAIFLSGWTWLYLYDKCSKKFWQFLASYAVCIVLFVIAFTVFFSQIATLPSRCPDSGSQCNFPTSFAVGFLFIALAAVIQIGIHIWSVVDVATKDESWYRSF